MAQVYTGQNELFTAQVTGTGTYNPAVNWSVNGVAGGNSIFGTITSGGQYTAPATVPNPNNMRVTATSAQTPSVFGNATANVFAPVVFASITPSAASAGQAVVLDMENGVDFPSVVFPTVNGDSITLPLTQESGNNFTIAVPFGAVSGNVYIHITTPDGVNIVTSSLPFTRLPNLLLHAPNKDLSSGESEQFEYRLLGASTPSVVTWTSDSGSISSSGFFTAPTVSSESYSHVTGCLQGTISCDTVLLRILPFRITPSEPIVGFGDTLQLGALQGSGTLSPTWSVLAGGGTINSAGLYTAPTSTAEAGGIPVQAQSGSTAEQTEVAVSGAFPGLVNRVYDYANFNIPQPPEARFVQSVAVNGNRAYTISTGNAFLLAPSHEALNVYDITNPDAPVWIDAGESATNSYAQLYTYGNILFSLDSNYIAVYSLTTQVPTLTEIIPVPGFNNPTFSDGVLYLQTEAPATNNATTVPIETFDFTNGSPVHNQYVLPEPSGGGQFAGVVGNQSTVFACWLTEIDNSLMLFIATYDVSQSPPTLVSQSPPTLASTTASELPCHLQVVGSMLFANSFVYDISNVTPVQVGTVPNTLTYIWGTEGNKLLATGGVINNYGGSANYVVLDLSSSAVPVVQANVVDLPSWIFFNPIDAAWVNSNTFYTADGTGGIAVYDVSAAGGPATASAQELFSYTYAQAINEQTLYSASQYGNAADLACLDVSGGTPNLVGSLYYYHDSASAVQASGTTVFLGLSDYLKIVDASNPAAPVEIGSVAIPVSALALLGNDLFVGTTDGRLIVYDVTNPASPNQLSSIAMPVASTMSFSGPLLLVAAGQSGLLVYDISNPSAPVRQSQYLPSGGAPVWDVLAPVTGVAVLAADSDGIIILNIANPKNPQVLNQQQLPFFNPFPAPSTGAGILTAFTLAYQNGLTYVGTGNAGIVFVYDASVPSELRLMALNVISPLVLDVVSAITPGKNNLYADVVGELIQLDTTIPQNSIELYFPLAALSNAAPITGDLRTAKTRRDIILGMVKEQSSDRDRAIVNPKFGWLSRGSAPPPSPQAGAGSSPEQDEEKNW